MPTLIIGDGKRAHSSFARTIDNTAVVCTNDNINDLDIPNVSIYTSPYDLSMHKIVGLIQVYSDIFFFEQSVMDVNNKCHIQAYLNYYASTKNIHGAVPVPAQLHSTRISNDPQLWVVGCSISDGIGVKENQRWGQLVSDYLNLPVSFLTCKGSSIEWAADQILRSDIRPNDIVCWGLTNTSRFLGYTDRGDQQHILISNPGVGEERSLNERLLNSVSLTHKAVKYVQQVSNYLDKIGAQLHISLMLLPHSGHEGVLLKGLLGIKNFFVSCDLYSDGPRFADLGSDNLHPGPNQHVIYAQDFIKSISK